MALAGVDAVGLTTCGAMTHVLACGIPLQVNVTVCENPAVASKVTVKLASCPALIDVPVVSLDSVKSAEPPVPVVPPPDPTPVPVSRTI